LGVVYACRGAGTRRGLYIEARTLERKGELCWRFVHDTCPYVQRTRMVLAYKGVPFELIEINLENEPDWFLESSPYGKVPDLKVGDAVLCELAIISEYLDEVYPEKRLPSEDPLERASQRILINEISNRFVPLFTSCSSPREKRRRATRRSCRLISTTSNRYSGTAPGSPATSSS
jgi:glutathione S-transferase